MEKTIDFIPTTRAVSAVLAAIHRLIGVSIMDFVSAYHTITVAFYCTMRLRLLKMAPCTLEVVMCICVINALKITTQRRDPLDAIQDLLAYRATGTSRIATYGTGGIHGLNGFRGVLFKTAEGTYAVAKRMRQVRITLADIAETRVFSVRIVFCGRYAIGMRTLESAVQAFTQIVETMGSCGNLGLCNQNRIAHGAMLAFSQTNGGAGGSNRCVNHYGMLLNLRAIANIAGAMVVSV